MTSVTPEFKVGEQVLLHRSTVPEKAYITAAHHRQTGVELVLRTVDPSGLQGQVVNVFAPYDGTSWVTVPDHKPLAVAGAA